MNSIEMKYFIIKEAKKTLHLVKGYRLKTIAESMGCEINSNNEGRQYSYEINTSKN
ncbi:MAG: hypothetical protein PVH88_07510 [Ignavibacteria bacterium]|jgi:hypothetical protein